ncbi:MAG: hypothetical protein EKK29_14805 [Hyphomicrobiales bacterium]|nr:MAG: hypothetical protein EKK29_14805 [Hyphomicrobiales bacterium]
MSPVVSKCLTPRTTLAMLTLKSFAAALRDSPVYNHRLHNAFAKIVRPASGAANADHMGAAGLVYVPQRHLLSNVTRLPIKLGK